MSDGKVLVSKPNSTWQIQRVFLQTVDEEKGDYVWVAIVNRQQSGGATFIPRFPIYFSLEGEYLAAIPIEKGDKAFKSCFTESSE